MVSLLATYFLWLVGGTIGLHHAYLGRTKQSWIWSVSMGLCLVGLLADMVLIPSYVREANGSQEYVKKALAAVDKSPQGPGRSFGKFVFMVITGTLFAAVIGCCSRIAMLGVDEESAEWVEMYGEAVFVALGASAGVWLAGNTGNTVQTHMPRILFGAFVAVGLAYLGMDEDEYSTAPNPWFCSLLATLFSKHSWRPDIEQAALMRQGRRGRCSTCTGILKLYLGFFMLYPFFLFASYEYGVFEVKQGDGTKVVLPVKIIVNNYFEENEEKLMRIKGAFEELFTLVQHHGFFHVYEMVKNSMIDIEKEALKTLDLTPEADVTAVRKQFRELSKKYHPDRTVNLPEEKRLEMEKEFEKIRRAYDILTETRSTENNRGGKRANRAGQRERYGSS